MKVVILLFKYHTNKIFRRLFWLLRLSQSKLGKNVIIEFPIFREENGNFHIGKNSVIQKYVEIGVGENASLIIGEAAPLENKGTILVNKGCHLFIEKKFKLGNNARLYVSNDWNFGTNVKIETNCSIFARESEKSGKLIIGNNSNIGDYTIMDVVDDIYIGNEVAIGPNCTLYTHDHIYTNKNVPAWKGGLISKPITIEDGAVYGGIPAKLIKNIL